MSLDALTALARRELEQLRYPAPNWEKLHKIDRVEWARYLMWLRETAGLPIENSMAVHSIDLVPGAVRVTLGNGEVIHTRKAILAMGREGSGALRWPQFATFDPARRTPGVFHSADDIDFSALKGKRIGILGAGASAFDNAAEALEAGAVQVVLFARRPILPQVNKSKWTAFSGFQHGYASLDDVRRWRFYTYIFSEQVPPPYESVLRCENHPGFSLRFGEPWNDILPGVTIVTPKGEQLFDAAIVCTGFDVNLTERPEVAPFRDAIETWRSHVAPEEAEQFPEEARSPYLGDAFQLQGRLPELARVHVFNWGSTMSHGALAGDIPGLDIGARRLATGIAGDLFLEDAERHWERLQAHNEDELKPTRYFVPLERRK